MRLCRPPGLHDEFCSAGVSESLHLIEDFWEFGIVARALDAYRDKRKRHFRFCKLEGKVLGFGLASPVQDQKSDDKCRSGTNDEARNGSQDLIKDRFRPFAE